MPLELSSLLAQASGGTGGGADALYPRGCDVRPLVEVNQQSIRLPQMGDSLSPLWRGWSGGCLGSEAAAAMYTKERQARGDRHAPEQQLDRGATGGWHLDLACQVCANL